MASKLLNVLNKIESGRKDCIAVMNNLGFDMPQEASFHDIAEEIEANVDVENTHFYIDPNMNNKYYDNPLDDPILLQPTEFVKNFANILKEAPTVVMNNNTFYPDILFLFTTDSETSTICTSSSINPTTSAAKIRIGYLTGWGVVTSDDAQYYMSSNTSSYEHTWDTTKDLIDPETGKHYKYVIGYASAARSHTITNSGIGTNHKLCACFVSAQMCSSMSDIISGTNINYQYIRYLDHLDNAPTDNLERCYKNPGTVAMIEIDKERDNATATANITGTVVCQSFLNNGNGIVTDNIAFLSITVYIKIPTFVLNWYQSGDLTCHNLKYLEITDPERQALKNATLDRFMPPLLKDCEALLDGFTTINQDVFKYYGTKKMLTLRNVTTLNSYAFRYCAAYTLSLPKYTNHVSSYAFHGTYIQFLDLPAITHLNTPILFEDSNQGVSNSIRGISMAELLDANERITIGPKLTTLYLPKCTYFPSTMIQNAKSLVNLTVGQGFKGNLKMNCCGNLSRESWLDLFDKLAVLGEDESYTLTLPSKAYTSSYAFTLTPDDYQTVIDKGWTVTFG